jgi:hypothetical protein
MKVFSLWAGVTFLGVFSSLSLADLTYSEYEFAKGADCVGKKFIFESELDEIYDNPTI